MRKLCTLIVMLLLVVTLMVGCANININIKTDETKEAVASTSAPTQPQTEPPLKDTLSMVDYHELTVSDIIAIWGDDYTVSNSLYLGGWGSFYYAQSDCPFIFYYKCSVANMGQMPDLSEKLSGIGYSFDAENDDYFIHDDVAVNFSRTDFESAAPQGEFHENQMDGGYTYSYTHDSYDVVCCWYKRSVNGPAESIVVSF